MKSCEVLPTWLPLRKQGCLPVVHPLDGSLNLGSGTARWLQNVCLGDGPQFTVGRLGWLQPHPLLDVFTNLHSKLPLPLTESPVFSVDLIAVILAWLGTHLSCFLAPGVFVHLSLIPSPPPFSTASTAVISIMPATPPPPPHPVAAFSFAGDHVSAVTSSSPARHREHIQHRRSSPELRRVSSAAPSTNFPPSPSLQPHISAAVAAMSLDPLPGPLASTYLPNNFPTPSPSAAQTPVTFNGRTFNHLPPHLAAAVQVANQQPLRQSRRGTPQLPVSFSPSA